jgi:hypothetical protein
MNHDKYTAGLALNSTENQVNILEEQITATEKVLANARAALALTKIRLVEQREALARLPE